MITTMDFQDAINGPIQYHSMVAVVLAYINKIGSMTLTQKLATTAITIAYGGEALMKFFIYLKRFNNPNIPNLKTEQILYGASAITDIGQMVFTWIGLTTS